MPLKRPTVSCVQSLEITRVEELQGGTLKLFVSNHTPVDGDVLATYTAIQCAAGGMGGQVVSDWGAAAAVSGVATTEAGTYTFTASGTGLPVTVYGVFYEDVNGDLAFAELIPTGGITISAAGQSVSFKPKMTRKSEF